MGLCTEPKNGAGESAYNNDTKINGLSKHNGRKETGYD